MPAISHVIRRGARYSYRRRLPVPFSNSCPITLNLKTSYPSTARRRAAVLSVCWEGLVLTYRGRSDLTAPEAQEIFQDALERELVRALVRAKTIEDLLALPGGELFWKLEDPAEVSSSRSPSMKGDTILRHAGGVLRGG